MIKFKIPEVNLDKFQLFTAFVLFWIGLGWLGLALSLLGIFYNAILVSYILLGIIFLAYLINFNQTKIAINFRFFLIFILTLISIFIFSFYTTPTIFSGRDQGSLSEAAIRLAQNHHLSFASVASQEFFKIYGAGPALNFPGFHYTAQGNLSTQFPLGYISWLAIFYSLIGLNGFVLANSITFAIFIFSFYLVARYYLRASSAIMATLLILSSFIFAWFFKFTLSENLAMMLTWFGIYEFVLFTKNKSRFYLLASLTAFTLLVFTRVEALGFLAVVTAMLLIKYKDWKYLFFVVIGKKILLVAGGFLVLYFFNLALDSSSYYSMLKGILSPFISLGSGLKDYSSADSVPFLATSFYVLKVFSAYALFNFLLFGIIGFIYLWRHKKFEILVPFLIILPTFAYIIHPSISADHPWMLRRFVFSIIPVSILYAVWFFDHFFKKRMYFYFVIVLLIATNLMVFVPFLTISPDKNLLPQIEKISENFVESDLILVDRDATGDGWSMMTGPLNFLFDKQAVYFFNPKDLAKIDQKKFSAIYFIIPDNKLDFYRQGGILQRLVPVQDYSIENKMLSLKTGEKQEMFSAPIELPKMQDNAVYGKIYLLKN
ncbi:MAG: hypothetical protein Q7T51_04325 [Candidatus Moranbacteria bacterium]|nr:hypothetical protein [Candidatus Moranbacteria bacterium]